MLGLKLNHASKRSSRLISCIILSHWFMWMLLHTHTYTIIFLPMMTSSNGNIFRVTGYLGGEFTGPGEFPTQRPVTRSFDVFFDLRLKKRLSKQWWGWWFETQSCLSRRHCHVPCVSDRDLSLSHLFVNLAKASTKPLPKLNTNSIETKALMNIIIFPKLTNFQFWISSADLVNDNCIVETKGDVSLLYMLYIHGIIHGHIYFICTFQSKMSLGEDTQWTSPMLKTARDRDKQGTDQIGEYWCLHLCVDSITLCCNVHEIYATSYNIRW